MRIRTQFIATFALFSMILVVVGVSLVITNRQTQHLQKQEDIAHALELGVRELSYLSNDFLLHGERQQRLRWETRFSSFSQILANFSPEDPVQTNLIQVIRTNQERLHNIFTEVASTLENRPPAGDHAGYLAMIRVSWSRIEVQSEGIAFNASQIDRMLEAKTDRLQRRRVVLLFALIGIFGAFLVISFITVNRRILIALADFQEKTRIIGSGDLHLVLEEKKADEIGDLSRAFNRMTADLRAVTASKADLEQEIHERRQVEEALRESEAKYKNLFENMTEEVHFWQVVRDENGAIRTWRLVDANPPALKSWGGMAIEEIRGKTTDEIFGPGATEHYMPVVQKIFTENSPYVYEDHFPQLDKHFRFTSVPLGEFFFTTGADITVIKKAELSLRESEERLRLLGDNLPESAVYQYTYAPDGTPRFIYFSAGIERLNGIRVADVLADAGSLHRQILPEYFERLVAAEAESARELSDFDMEVPMGRPDGAVRWMRLHSRPRRRPGGSVVWDGVQIDITERKRAEEALRLTQESIDGAAEMVAWFTPDGRLHYVNDATCRTLGYSRDELLHMTALDFSPGFTWEQYREHWQEVRELKSFILETTHRRKDGSEYPAEVLVNYAIYEGREYIFAYGRDITERKRAEELLTASLAEKEVMLKEIHHRVKNNLQVISSLVSMQADNLTDERTREEFDDVCDRVRSMALIHEKLYQTDNLAQLNFADYSTSLLHSLWSSHDVLAEKVTLNLALAPVALSIETAVPCGLILNELASNALKHAFPNNSDGEVTVGLEHDAATDIACLWVRDNGVGLSPVLDWRQSSSLGLRLVQILTGQLRGTVETAIGTGTGTEFRVTFPLKGSQS